MQVSAGAAKDRPPRKLDAVDRCAERVMVLAQLPLPTRKADGSDAMMSLGETRRELMARFNGVTVYVTSPAKGGPCHLVSRGWCGVLRTSDATT